METPQACNAIEVLHSNGFELICLTGGEPLIRADLPILLEKVVSVGMKAALITNGALLTASLLGRIENYLSGVCFSIDGFEPVHDRIRGAGSFKRVARALDMVSRNSRIATSASVTLNMLNIAWIRQILTWLLTDKVSEIHINDLNMTGNAAINSSLLGIDWCDQLREELLSDIKYATGQSQVVSSSTCTISKECICMGSDGFIYPCSELMTARAGSVCHISNPKLPAKLNQFYSTTPQTRCKYTDYSIGPVSVILNNSGHCLLKGE
jgi:MoaA/NifB/PqqE/SkfB family radical SAM enzyme